MQQIVVIQSQPPFNKAHAREALDLILALGAVDHQVSVIFTEDSVYQLLNTAPWQDAPLKAFNKSFGLFALYDIENCLVCQQAWQSRGLTALALPSGFRFANSAELKAIILNADQLIRC